MPKAKFDHRKALHAMLFVVTHLPKPANAYNVLKCLYYADRKHLQEYGRQIYRETFYALKHGPVPSAAYEIIKYANGRAKWFRQPPCAALYRPGMQRVGGGTPVEAVEAGTLAQG